MNLPKPQNISTSANISNNTNEQAGKMSLSLDYIALANYQNVLIMNDIRDKIVGLTNEIETLVNFLKDQFTRDKEKSEEKDIERSIPKIENEKIGVRDVIEGLGITAAVLGIATAITYLEESIRDSVEGAIAYMNIAKNKTMTFISKIPTFFDEFINAIKIRIAGAIVYVNTVFDDLITKIVDVVDNIRKNNFVIKIEETFSRMSTVFANVAKKIGTIIETVGKPIITMLDTIVSGGTKILSVLMKGASKIFLPLQIVLSAIDFINGFIEGWNKEGILEGIKIGLEKVFDGIFGSIIRLLSDIVTWIAEKLGLDNFAEKIGPDIEATYKSIEQVFSSVLGIFKGLLTFDGQAIWDNLKTGFSGIGGFLINAVSGAINSIVNLFADIFNIKMESPFDFKKFIVDKIYQISTFMSDLFPTKEDVFKALETVKNKIKNLILEYGNSLFNWTKELIRSTLESIPGGTKLANKLVGPREVTEDELKERANEIARERTIDDMSWREWLKTGLNPDKHPLEINITNDDINAAKKSLSDEGFSIPNKIQTIDLSQINANKLSDIDKADTKSIMQFNNQTINTTSGRGQTQVIPVTKYEKASPSNPIRRGGGGY